MNLFTKKNFIITSACFLVFFPALFIVLRFDLGRDLFLSFIPKTEQAKFMLYTCFNVSDTGARYECLDAKLPELFKKYGAATVMASYEDYVSKVGETFTNHGDTHKIGEALFSFVGGDIHEAFSLCTTVAHNGCQHALLGEVGKEIGKSLYEISDLVVELCNGNESTSARRLCFHGLGHGLLVERGGEIKLALRDCDNFPISDFLKRECWSGVFMENFTSIMGGGGKYIKEDDPLYPCTMLDLDEKYIRTCYIQVPIPFARRIEGFEICRTAPEQWVTYCGMGIGMRLAAQRTVDINLIIEKCRYGGDLKSPCLEGALSYLELADNKDIVEEYCGKLAEEESNVCRFVDN